MKSHSTLLQRAITKSVCFAVALSMVAATDLLFAAPRAKADSAVMMAPPMQSSAGSSMGGGQTNPGTDSVFNWTEVPQNQQVPIQRAVFDQGGYQLYDKVGETIVIPFSNQNLYVMKFGQSTDGTMYFINQGNAPVLYVPQNGYLENAAVPGTRWYPFTEKFHPAQPVFLGIAPSWHVFIGMGWYSGMYCHGGYWSHAPFVSGSIVLASVGLFFVIGGHHYDGWNGYHNYIFAHPAPYHVRIVNNYFYGGAHHAIGGGRSFAGAGHVFSANHVFRGAGAFHGTQAFHSGQAVHSGQTFRGATSSGGGRTFHGGQTFHGTHSSGSHSIGGSGRSHEGREGRAR